MQLGQNITMTTQQDETQDIPVSTVYPCFGSIASCIRFSLPRLSIYGYIHTSVARTMFFSSVFYPCSSSSCLSLPLPVCHCHSLPPSGSRSEPPILFFMYFFTLGFFLFFSLDAIAPLFWSHIPLHYLFGCCCAHSNRTLLRFTLNVLCLY